MNRSDIFKSDGCVVAIIVAVIGGICTICAAIALAIVPPIFDEVKSLLPSQPALTISSPSNGNAVGLNVPVVVDLDPAKFDKDDKLYIVLHPTYQPGFNFDWYVVGEKKPDQKKMSVGIKVGNPTDKGSFEIWAIITNRSLENSYSPAAWNGIVVPTLKARHVITVTRK